MSLRDALLSGAVFGRARHSDTAVSRRGGRPGSGAGMPGLTHVQPLALEPRFMFDAAGVATGAEAAQDAAAEAEAAAGDPADGAEDEAGDGDDQLAAAVAGHTPPAERKEVVIADRGVADIETLLKGMDLDIEVIYLDSGATFEDLAAALEGRSGIDAVHLLSHGSAGSVILSGETLTLDSLNENADALRAIGDAMSQDGDLLLYGCKIGADGVGEAFLAHLSDLTGADIAASTNDTGAAALGGDWVLEHAVGAVESGVAVSSAAQQEFAALLATFTFSTATDRNPTITETVSGVTLTISTAGPDTLQVLGAGTTGAASGDFVVASNASQGTLTFAFSSAVDLTSIVFGDQNNAGSFNWVFTPTGGSNSTVTDPNDTVNASTHTRTITLNWTGVTSFTVTRSDSSAQTTSVFDTLIFTAANSAPTLGGTPADDAATEDVATAIDLSAYNVSDADGDTITLTLAVDRGTIASVDGNGITDGVTVANSGTASMTLQGTAANLNTYLNNTSKITYTTAANDTTTAVLTVTPNDGTANGTADTVNITITAVNDAPVLNAGVSPALTGIAEDAGDDDGSGADGDDDATNNANNSGTSIAAMVVDGSITDPDGAAVEAIAVTAVDNTNGVWQYSTNNGASWNNFSGTTGSSVDLSSAARLLDGTLTGAATHLVRFVPDANYNGSATITFRAWDRSSGSAGGTANASSGGGSTAFSTATDTASVAVSAVNDNPTAASLPASVTVTEDTQGNIDLSAVSFADVDSASITVTLTASAGSFATPADGAGVGGGVTETRVNATTITLVGAPADINTYLDTASNIQYTGAANAAGAAAATITVTANDGDGSGNVNLGTVNVNITAVNDNPAVASLPASVTVTEDAQSNIDLSAASFSDVDSASITVTLTASAGTFATPANGAGVGGGVTATRVNATTITLVGAPADITTYLDTASNIQYTPAANVSGTAAATITVTANDGDGSGNVNLGTVNVNVTAVNDAPAFTGLDGTPAFTEDGAAVVLDANVTVADVELGALNGGNGNFAGASLVIVRNGGANASDQFSIQTGGNLTVAGSNVSAGGNVIASFDTSSAGQVTVTFQNNGTIPTTALVNEVMQAIRYTNASNDPAASVQLNWTFSDGNSANAQGTGANPGTGTGSTTVSVTNVNDAPTLAATGGNPTFTENTAAPGVDLYNTVSASAVEAADRFASMTLTVTNVSDGASEILRFDGSDVALTNGNSVTTATNSLSVSVSVTGSTATVSFSGATLTNAQMQTLVDGLAYRNTSDNPTTAGNRVVTITGITDTGGTSGGGQNSAAPNLASTVSLTAVNDPPVVGGVFGETSQVTAGTGAQNVSGLDDATVANVDSADFNGGFLTIVQGSGTTNGSWGVDGTTVTSGGNGTIAASETIAVGGVSIGTVHATNDGQGGNTLQIDFNANATAARVQALVQALTYSAPSSLGNRGFTLTLNDADGTANGGDQDASGSFTINVTPNPPVIGNLNGDSVSAASNVAVAIDAGGNATVTDADSANFNGGNLTITRTSGLSGGFSLNNAAATSGGDGTIGAGQTIAVGGTDIGTVTTDGQGTNNLVITFNSADATPARVQALIRALQYASTAGGAHTFNLTITDAGASAATSTAAGFTVNVQAAPVNTVPGAQTATDGTATAITGISVADADSANVTTTVSVGAGQGAFSTTGAATITGGGTNSIQISGTLAAVNATLANLQYTPAVNASGAQTITVATTDGTNSDSDTITVNVADRPTIGNVGGDAVTFTEGGGAVRLDAGANGTLTDADNPANLNGGNLTATVSGGAVAAQDILSVSGGGATLAGTTAGSNVSVGGTVIGTLANNVSAGNDFRVNLNANATLARVQTLLQALAYDNQSTAPTTGDRTVSITVTDNTGRTGSAAAVTVTVNGVNAAPVLTGVDNAPAFTEGGAAVVLDADMTVADVELDAFNGGAGNYSGASVTFQRVGGANAQDVFSNSGTLGALTEGATFQVGGTTIGTVTTNSGGTLTLTFNGNATSALVDSAIQQVAYSNASDAPPASAQIAVTFSDGNTGAQGTGGALSDSDESVTVAITAVNDAPTVQTGSAAGFRIGGAEAALLPNAVLADVDSATVSQAVITLSGAGFNAADVLAFANDGATMGNVTGSYDAATGAMTLTSAGGTATLAQMQAAVRAVTFSTTSGPGADRTVSLQLDDGTAASATAQTTLNVQAAPAAADDAFVPPPGPPPAPPPAAPPPAVTPPPDGGTPVGQSLGPTGGGGGPGQGPGGVTGGAAGAPVTGQLGSSSPIENSGTPVGAGLQSSSLGGGGLGGGGGAGGGGFGGGFGGGAGGGAGGGFGDGAGGGFGGGAGGGFGGGFGGFGGAPGGGPGLGPDGTPGLNGAPGGPQGPGEENGLGGPPAGGPGEGAGEQAGGEQEAYLWLAPGFTEQLAAEGGGGEARDRALARALLAHTPPAA